MHNDIYASGFLYHPSTQQILLHQPQKSPSVWHMLGGKGHKAEDSKKAFQRVIYKLLAIEVDLKHIFPVYDYFHAPINKTHHVFYAQLTSMPRLNAIQKTTFSWFTFKQTLKLAFTEQTKQDMVVSERVIKAEIRSHEVIPPAFNSYLVHEA